MVAVARPASIDGQGRGVSTSVCPVIMIYRGGCFGDRRMGPGAYGAHSAAPMARTPAPGRGAHVSPPSEFTPSGPGCWRGHAPASSGTAFGAASSCTASPCVGPPRGGPPGSLDAAPCASSVLSLFSDAQLSLQERAPWPAACPPRYQSDTLTWCVPCSQRALGRGAHAFFWLLFVSVFVAERAPSRCRWRTGDHAAMVKHVVVAQVVDLFTRYRQALVGSCRSDWCDRQHWSTVAAHRPVSFSCSLGCAVSCQLLTQFLVNAISMGSPCAEASACRLRLWGAGNAHWSHPTALVVHIDP